MKQIKGVTEAEASADMQEETRRNIRFKVSNSGADDKWKKYSGWDWGAVRSITRELEKIWRADNDHTKCFQTVEGEENRESERRREEICKKNRRTEDN